jgi:serine/threonine protein kinase
MTGRLQPAVQTGRLPQYGCVVACCCLIQESWPGWDQLTDCKHLQWKPQESQLRSKFPTVFFGGSAPVLSDAGFDLLSKLLEMNPAKRITAEDALKHKWVHEAPRPVTPALMPSFTPRHQQSSAADFRDKLQRPSPGAVGPAGFKI